MSRLVLLGLSGAGILAFFLGVYPPVFVSVAAFAVAGGYIVSRWRHGYTGLLPVLYFLVFALPFIHLIPYLWFDFDGEAPVIMWGMPVNPYMIDREVVRLMGQIGAVGALALAVGAGIVKGRFVVVDTADRGQLRASKASSLDLVMFSIWIGIGLLFYWLYAPRETIFEAPYTQGVAIAEGWDFGSIWMLSQIVFIYTLVDAMLDVAWRRAKMKVVIWIVAILVVVMWLGLMRGDREALPLVVASIVTWGVAGRQERRHRKAVLGRLRARTTLVAGAVIVGLVVVSAVVGAVRSQAAGRNVVDVMRELREQGIVTIDNMIYGTWSAVLLTPLSVAGDYLGGRLEPTYGRTYLDYVLSLPPGFVARWIGYQRPLDAWHGPAWEMTYGIGGVHAVVVPFMNFLMVGVFAVLMLLGWIVAAAERWCVSRRRTVVGLALWATLVAVAPHWLWYGDKYVINAVIIWWLLSLLYGVARLVPVRVRNGRSSVWLATGVSSVER